MASDLLTQLKRQHQQCIQALESFDIVCDNVITWESLEESITPTQITLIEKMGHPQLVLTPNLRYSQIGDKINHRTPLSEAKERTILGEENIFLYNGGRMDKNNQWEASIIDLAPQDLSSLNIKHPISPSTYINQVVTFYTDKGLQVLTGARSYYALIIVLLFLKEPIEVSQEIVLNAEYVAKDPTSHISAGSWYDALVHLHLYDSETPWSVLYIYPEVRLV